VSEEEAASVGEAETEEAAGSVAGDDGSGGLDAAPEAAITPATPSTGTTAGAHPGTGTVVVTVGSPAGSTGTTTTSPPVTTAPPPPAEEIVPPVEEEPPLVTTEPEAPEAETTP
jgi:hypothetical protein